MKNTFYSNELSFPNRYDRIHTFLFIITTLLISIALPFITSTANAQVFMDLESSIQELNSFVDRVSQSIVKIKVYDDAGDETAEGSGFFIDGDGKILTNAELLTDAYSAEVISESQTYKTVTILKLDSATDLALLQVNDSEESPLKLDFAYQAKEGDKVAIVGRTSTFRKTLSEGRISSVSKMEGVSEFIKIKISPQLSGLPVSTEGPLLTPSGSVIGMTTRSVSDHPVFGKDAYVDTRQQLLSVGIQDINLFLEKPDDLVQLEHGQSRVWLTWISKRITTFSTESFVFLYNLGFPKMIGILLAIVIIIGLGEWGFLKVRKVISKRN